MCISKVSSRGNTNTTRILNFLKEDTTSADPITGNEVVHVEDMKRMLDSRSRDEPIYEILDGIVRTQALNRVFTTRGGRLGFAYGDFKSGDKLVVFDGSNIIHIIRKHADDRPNTYTLMGAGYTRGMMHGQVEELGSERLEMVLV